MELKFKEVAGIIDGTVGSNRTFMELKFKCTGWQFVGYNMF